MLRYPPTASRGFALAGSRESSCSLYLPFGAEARSGWTENLGLLSTTACVFLAIGLLDSDGKRSFRWLAAFGLCGGIALMMRPVISLWLVVPLAFFAWKHRRNARFLLRGAFISALSIAIVMAPWVIRNEVTFHRFDPLWTRMRAQRGSTQWAASS